MKLKKIPAEFKALPPKKQKSILLKIKNRLSVEKNKKSHFELKKACFSIMNFLSNEGSMQIKDLNNLIHTLERSIIVVQSSKKKLVDKERQKQ